LDAALAAIENDRVFALIHLVVEQRVKAYQVTS
jgi:acetolactate synthase-1/2/3 large subunit